LAGVADVESIVSTPVDGLNVPGALIAIVIRGGLPNWFSVNSRLGPQLFVTT